MGSNLKTNKQTHSFLLLFVFTYFSACIYIFSASLSNSFLSCFMCVSSPLLQIYIYFASCPFTHIHIYLQKHYNIMVLLNYRIRSTVWLQLTFVLAKPFYFLPTGTIGDGESIQGQLWRPSYSLTGQRLHSAEIFPQTQLLAEAAAVNGSSWYLLKQKEHCIMGFTLFLHEQKRDTCSWRVWLEVFLQWTVCSLNHMKLKQIKLTYIML